MARVLLLKSLGSTAPLLIALLVTAPGAMSLAWIKPVAATAEPPSAMKSAVPARSIEGVGSNFPRLVPACFVSRLNIGTAPLADRRAGAV